MQSLSNIIQLIISILLIIVIVLQRSDKGLDGAFGGSDTGGNVKFRRRGPELFYYRATIVLAIALVAVALVTIII
jgi:protein translocase SecG subunit